MYFSKEHLGELSKSLEKVKNDGEHLGEMFLQWNFKNTRAREYSNHGFGRRIRDLMFNLEQVFEILPPDYDGLPEKARIRDATSHIHAFMFNTSGCFENLAWIWVFERELKKADGSELSPSEIGLNSNCRIVWRSLPQQFRDYLNGNQKWFAHIKDFRDALAHRIPLYIPPFSVSPEHEARYQELEGLKLRLIRAHNFHELRNVEEEQKSLCFFRPWMTHSYHEEATVVVFHPQLIANFRTVVEVGHRFLGALDNDTC